MLAFVDDSLHYAIELLLRAVLALACGYSALNSLLSSSPTRPPRTSPQHSLNPPAIQGGPSLEGSSIEEDHASKPDTAFACLYSIFSGSGSDSDCESCLEWPAETDSTADSSPSQSDDTDSAEADSDGFVDHGSDFEDDLKPYQLAICTSETLFAHSLAPTTGSGSGSSEGGVPVRTAAERERAKAARTEKDIAHLEDALTGDIFTHRTRGVRFAEQAERRVFCSCQPATACAKGKALYRDCNCESDSDDEKDTLPAMQDSSPRAPSSVYIATATIVAPSTTLFARSKKTASLGFSSGQRIPPSAGAGARAQRRVYSRSYGKPLISDSEEEE